MKFGNSIRQIQKQLARLLQHHKVQSQSVPRTIYNAGKRVSFKLLDTAISAYAGQAAFMLILSFFPFVMFLLALLRYLPLTPEVLISAVEHFFPVSFRSFMTTLVNQIYKTQSSTILPVTVITALWLGSRSFLSIIYGLNSVYEIPETRGYITLRLWAVFYTLLFALLIIATLVLLVFGNQLFLRITHLFPMLTYILLPVIGLRSAVSFLVMVVFFTGMYRLIPNHKMHGFTPEYTNSQVRYTASSNQEPVTLFSQLPGAILATVGWMGFSYLYSFYVDHISNYSSFYGAMTMIALLMVWLYFCMYIVFFGGWINYTFHRILHFL
jgi:membrane protein